MSDPSNRFKYVFQNEKRLNSIRKRFSFSLHDMSEETVPVYVRLKPREPDQTNNFIFVDTFSSTLKIKKKNVKKSYKFTNIFRPETTQKQIFQDLAEPYLRGFLNGTRNNVVMFTYGVSSSGKTYTIQGVKGEPGILPRMLTTIFKTLDGFIETNTLHSPELGSSAGELTPQKRDEYKLKKEIILMLSKTLQKMTLSKSNFMSYTDFEKLKVEADTLEDNYTDQKYSIWFSYYEIYNEQVYDLFEEPKDTKIHLRIINDTNCTSCIEGLKWIQVSSLYEAFLVYSYGRYNLTTSSTRINERSSRSHSVFTVRIIRACTESSEVSSWLSSSFSVCDLAGTERVERTRNVGIRLKEAQRINTSFLTLNRCLRIIRENQSSGQKRYVPYRESKLTKVLGPALSSPDTSLLMIVTVSQSEELIEETESSLKASSVAATIEKKCLRSSKRLKKGPFSKLVPNDKINWKEVEKKKTSKSPEMEPSMRYVYRELQEEKNKRKIAEDKLQKMENVYKEKIRCMEQECIANAAEGNMRLLQKELEEHQQDLMASKAENLKLKKTVTLLHEDIETLEKHIKTLQSINKGLLDEAKEDIQTHKNVAKELQKALSEREQIIILKDEKLHTLEIENSELEQNLEKNAKEIEAYEKQLRKLFESFKLKELEYLNMKEKYEKGKENRNHEKSKVYSQNKNEKNKSSILQDIIPTTPQQRFNLRSRAKSQLLTKQNEGYRDYFGEILISARRTRTISTKKRKHQRNATQVVNVTYNIGSKNAENKQNHALQANNSVKKKLFRKSSKDLSDVSEDEKICEQIQLSPTTIMKRTLRTGKHY